MNRISPRDVLNPLIESRASKIEDPVAKLRFLRQTDKRVGYVEKVWTNPRYWLHRTQKFWLAIGFVILVPASSLFRSAAPVTPVLSALPRSTRPAVEAPLDKVWLIDTKNSVETWSNGLHVETRYTTKHRPRESYVWNRNSPNSTLTQLPGKQPAGIVYHTTESTIEELEEHRTRRLKLLGESLLHLVQKEKAYHYLIDRFGRVFRIVEESDVANHAGKSIWADEKWAYIGLNESFLAVSFEAQTTTGDQAPSISQAQIDAGRMLTRMLRSRYGIKANNCVTHAQVSINAGNFLIGWHTDWAANFPFEEMALPDNYALPIPGINLFGFSYDGTFFAATGARMWKGVVSSEDLLREEAKQKSISVAQLRSQLRNNYRRLSTLLPENTNPDPETKSGTTETHKHKKTDSSNAPEVNP